MSEIKSQFFNGKTYSATDFVESNKNTMKDGILPNTDFFKVLPASNMTIGVASGRGWVKGHAFSSDSTLAFTLDRADGVLDRVDTVVIRLDLTTDSEKIECRVIKGALGGSATAPVRNGTYYDLVIAQIAVAHGTTAIATAMITDKRGDGNLCGWSGAISGDQFNFDTKAPYTYVDTEIAKCVKTATLTAYQLTITNGTTKTNADRLQGNTISTTAPTTGQIMCYNGSQWAPKALGAATMIANGTIAVFTNAPKLNYSQAATSFRYIAYHIERYVNSMYGTYASGENGFIPVGILDASALDASASVLFGDAHGYGIIKFLFTSTSVSASYEVATGVSAFNPSVIVWGVN